MNTKKTILATLLASLAVTPLAVTPVSAQQYYTQVQAPASHLYTQAELDQMLAPIALYPDALLSQILMAATYPIEVVEAARWSRSHPRLQGDDAVRAVYNEDWDPSVRSLVAFPQILERMDENLEWTRTLGDAFLAQEPQMMDQVQRLRRRAQAAGHLQTSDRIRVEHQGPVIIVRQASPEYIYVPYYDPMEVYGTWMWPAYRPVAWSPWPGYSRGYRRPGVSAGFWWGSPVGLSLGFFFGDFDWNQRHAHVAHSNSYYYRAPAYVNRGADRGRWQHDPQHRRAVAYRDSEVRQRFASAQMERREAVREERRDERQLERRTDRREDRREDRQATRQQAQPAATVQAQPQAVTPVQRAERRDEARTERREDRRDDRRAERQAALAAAPAQPAAQPRAERRDETRVERREDRREERRAQRQAAPTATPAQPAAQPRAEQRDDRRAERQAAMDAQRQARQQAQQQQAQEGQRQAQQQARQQAQDAQRQAQQQAQQAQRQAQQQARQAAQPAPTMPAAQAPQTPRADRDERREKRQEARKDRDKG